jgi:hypothetical protein
VLILLFVADAAAQYRKAARPTAVRKIVRLTHTPRSSTLSFSVGVAVPQSHLGLTKYWAGGPNGSFKLLFGCSRFFKVGLGADLSLLYFKKGAFSQALPGVAIKAEDVSLLNAYVAMRLYARPALRLSPFVGVDFGMARVAPANYRSLVAGKEVTYYDLPGSTHLSVGVSGGLDYYLSRSVAIELEGRGIWVDGNTDLGVTVYAGAGLKFTL